MNWEMIGAIGESIGALAVVATLIYFSRQIRSLTDDSYANAINQVDQGERDLHRLYIENEEVIRKANRGEALSEQEAFLLEEVFLTTWGFHLFSFIRSSTYGRDGEIQVRNVARILRRYPGFIAFFQSERFRDDMGIKANEFLQRIDAMIPDGDA